MNSLHAEPFRPVAAPRRRAPHSRQQVVARARTGQVIGTLLVRPRRARTLAILAALVAAGAFGLRHMGTGGPVAAGRTTVSRPPHRAPDRPTHWIIRSIDTMKVSRDTSKKPLGVAQIAALVRLDARLHPTHVTVDVYYDDPDYLARWVGVIRSFGLRVWFRAHWYAWENHRDARGSMSPHAYIAATRHFLQTHAALLRNGDIFDFCPEPENGAYWLRTYGPGWSWRNPVAKHAFNTFVRAGVQMAGSTLSNRGLDGVIVTAISVNPSIALRLLSRPTVDRLGHITLDVYPEGATCDPSIATRRLLAQIARVHDRWQVPVVLGETGYARDVAVDDTTQARVLARELGALAALPYLQGMNYWVDAGGPGYGGYTNLYRRSRQGTWVPRPAATVLAAAYAAAQ